jgi:type II secretory pathway pseudopilin PulG
MAIGRGIEALEPRRPDADRTLVRAVLRREGGFGLIELLLAMTMLNIGLLAVVAAFSSGIVSLNRASRITTAAVLADGQMELYRALKYDAIRLDPTSIPGTAPYTTDTAYSASQVTDATCSGPTPPECNASRQVTGADGKSYMMQTFIVNTTPTGGRQIKKVTVVVRDYSNQTLMFARQVSTFDPSTG